MTSNQWLGFFFCALFALYWLIMGFVCTFTLTQDNENPTLKDLATYFGLGGAIIPAMLIYKIITGRST